MAGNVQVEITKCGIGGVNAGLSCSGQIPPGVPECHIGLYRKYFLLEKKKLWFHLVVFKYLVIR
jgi:hypothetical protein